MHEVLEKAKTDLEQPFHFWNGLAVNQKEYDVVI
jgi:hypothetical protein